MEWRRVLGHVDEDPMMAGCSEGTWWGLYGWRKLRRDGEIVGRLKGAVVQEESDPPSSVVGPNKSLKPTPKLHL